MQSIKLLAKQCRRLSFAAKCRMYRRFLAAPAALLKSRDFVAIGNLATDAIRLTV